MPEADSSPEPKPAPRLGSYLLVQALGSGGMSNVFRAVHEESGNVVAVKVLPRTLAKNVTLLQRFMREAKSAEALDHPNIVAIYDRGFDQGRHYLVLEYVEGRDLHDRVRLNGPLAPDEAVRFIREVAEGLRYASAQGMIHRDVKPANLLMTPDGHAKIIDLGLALQIQDEDERVTRDGTTVGTVDYMAPEQARDSRQTSERSDIYSLGCTFYYLLTGSPPYPGGGLSDKLARHYKAPIPEVREHRADVPESLSLLVRKMMEKKPEARPADYTRLIEALDALGDPPTHDVTSGTLDALIAEDDEDDEIGLAPTETALARNRDERPPSSREQFLTAEIVDDEDDEPKPTPTLPPPGPRPRGREAPARPRPAVPSEPAELSLAELAGLDSDDSPASRRQVQGSSPSSPTTKAASNSSQPAHRSPSVVIPAVPVDEDEEEVYGAEGGVRKGPGADLPLKTWISAAVMVGLSIAIVAFGASMLFSLTKEEAKPSPPEKPVEEASNEGVYTPPSNPGRRPDGPRERIANNVTKKKDQEKKVEPPPPEPIRIVTVEEATYPPEWESKLAPPPLGKSVPPVDPKARSVVRRVSVTGEEGQFPSIAAAFSRSNDMVEIADVGPFFEDDCQVAGKSRLIRAREGFRPMIKVEFADNEIIKGQAAKFVLGGTRVDHLVFERIDFAVNVRDLPDHQATLFLCQGADLTFRDCSLTILNANDQARPVRFSLFRVEEGAKPNRITFERSMIRGPVGTLIDLGAARAEVVFNRSLILGDTSPLIHAEAVDKPSRSFYFYRSILATRGPVLDFAGKPNPTLIRSLGTIFARVEGGNGATAAPFVARSAFPGEPPTVLDWSGEDNEFIGWSGWLTAGSDSSARVSGLDGVRSSWPGSDGSSRESTSPWPALNRPDEILAAEFVEVAPGWKPTLLKIAAPHPRFRDLTFGSLARLPTPELSADLLPRPVPAAAGLANALAPAMPKPVLTAPPPNATGPRLKNAAIPKKGGPAVPGAPPPLPGPLKLTFDVRESPWLGDLGLYLSEKLVPGTPQVTVQLKGSGVFATTAIRFADGLSIAILGDPTQPLSIFKPKLGSAGKTMFELHRGDLAIANLGFSSEGAIRPKHWVLSEDGILALRRCWFRDPTPGGAASGVAPLIAFVAKGTAPVPPRSGPLVKETDRPTARLQDCLMWTTGDAITAEVGRGVVDLDNCLIISGGPAFTLLPRDVARDKFEADLILERCTVATDKTSLLLGPLAGEPVGPSRPWLVSTRRCAFPRTQPAGGAGALLQVDSDAMARGVLFWQSSYDAYDSLHLLASTAPGVANLPSTDVKKQWIDLWGAEHTKGDQGPTARRNEVVLRYKDKERPRPGKVVPAALDVDKAVVDSGVEFKDLPSLSKAPAEGSAAKGSPPPAGKGAFAPRIERP